MTNKLLVVGSKGFIGSTFRQFASESLEIIDLPREIDLRNYEAVEYSFSRYKPDLVIHAAGRVGGITLNRDNPVSQFTDNILINTNVINAAHKVGVSRLLAFSSLVGFPYSDLPLTEDMFQVGIPNTLYKSYAYTKRAMDVHIEAYRTEYKADYCSLILANTFGETDSYDIKDAHVIPGLIARANLSVKNNTPYKLWGNGSDSRAFTYYKDVTKVCLKLLLHKEKLPQRITISSGQEYTIKQLATIISKKFNIDNIEWETKDKINSYPGRLDTTLLKKYIPDFKFTDVEKAVEYCCDKFIESNR
jgi:GDP-L-fucose synthase